MAEVECFAIPPTCLVRINNGPLFFLFGIWNLWLFRNKRLFARPFPFCLRKAVENQVAEFFFCVLDHANVTRTRRVFVGWTKPQDL